MNGASFGIIAILIVALFAVSLGSQQVYNQHTKLIEELSSQRQVLIDTAQEALTQRDGEIARSEALAEQVAQLAKDLDAKEKEIASKDAEISHLMSENRLQMEKIASLSQNVPVTGSSGSASVQARSNEKGQETVFQRIIAEPVSYLVSMTPLKGIQVIIFIFLGGVLMGGGGYAAFRSDSERRYTVHMTREQLKDYIRYQREH